VCAAEPNNFLLFGTFDDQITNSPQWVTPSSVRSPNDPFFASCPFFIFYFRLILPYGPIFCLNFSLSDEPFFGKTFFFQSQFLFDFSLWGNFNGLLDYSP
jgi:hypothetical protein